ncbi:MAG: hypothetical protein MJ070_00720 [Lachnospiraceae bacterium]|nr:hypothetical protein [Lachnospiraceae bacterium]
MADKKIIIGIDGGGTKTALAAYREGTPVASAKTGPMNYNFIGADRAAENVLAGVRALGIPVGTIGAIGIGDPSIDDTVGTDPDSVSAKFVSLLKKALGVQVFVRSDAYMTLFGLTEGRKPGVLILSGTGAMGIAQNPEGHLFLAGGWGRISGDEGSGYYIAVEAIKAALRAIDGIAPATALTDALTGYFGVGTPRELITRFYPENGEPDIAGFAEAAASCAEKGDACAKKILTDAAGFLASYASVLMERTGSRTVGIYGSVLTRNRTVRAEFERLILEKYPDAGIMTPAVSPERAAAIYAGLQVLRER